MWLYSGFPGDSAACPTSETDSTTFDQLRDRLDTVPQLHIVLAVVINKSSLFTSMFGNGPEPLQNRPNDGGSLTLNGSRSQQ
jgi:hypothetical protein